jgi:hypothetical protein
LTHGNGAAMLAPVNIFAKFLSGASAALVLSLLTGCQTASAPKSGGRDLFNGRDFTGWTFCMRANLDPLQTWSVTNGVIHCLGRPNGYLRTEKRYHDYRLTVEWRFVKAPPRADNTGVLVHLQPPDVLWPKCFECQGMHNQQGDFWLWGGAAGKEPVNLKQNGIARQQPAKENPVGEWNTYQVVCAGKTIEIIVNGKSVNKITGCNPSSGSIGIQSEGAEIEVRKIHLAPLN